MARTARAGHNLGVVTAIDIGLIPVTRLYGGSILFGDKLVEDAVRTYLEWTETVPDELTSSLAVTVFPDLPVIPERLRGRYTASIRVAYTGDPASGERLVAPLRAIGPALDDSLRELPYTDSATIHSDPERAHAYYGDSLVLRGLDPASARRLLALSGPEPPVWCVTQINHLGGALAKDRPNAVPYREARFLVRLLSALQPGTDVAAVRTLHGEVFAALAPLTLGR